jgi:hypothetical protein
MPSSLATSGTVEPEASLPSACRSLPTICSGEYLLPMVFESPPFANFRLLDSHRNWTRFRGSGHPRRHRDGDAHVLALQPLVEVAHCVRAPVANRSTHYYNGNEGMEGRKGVIRMVELAPSLQEKMVERRRYLHQHPELSFQEHDTP